MLELLDTGRMAHKHGKWRGAIAIVYAVGLFLVATVLANLDELVSTFGRTVDTTDMSNPVLWLAIGTYLIAMLLMLFGSWQLYRDFEHGDYYNEK